MKRLRTWAWTDRDAIYRKLRAASWGESFWKRYTRRRFEEQARRQLKQQMAGMQVHLVPLADVAESIQPPPAPVVH